MESRLECEQWQRAMAEKSDVLIGNNTWTLTSLPVRRKLIRNKWVIKLKYDIHSSIDDYKARLVAKGFTQRESLE